MISITCNCVEISAFNEGVAAILTSDDVGFINTKGELIIPTIFEQVSHTKRINTRYMFKEGLSAFVRGGKCGYIDKKGNIVISPEYDAASPFNGGIATVSREGKWGAIDKNGKLVVPIEYDFAQPFSEGVCGVFKDNCCGYVDKSGNEVIPLTAKYDIVNPFKCGIAVVMVGKWTIEKGVNETNGNNRFGAVNKNGELVVELKYQYLSDFSETLAAASIDGQKMYINTAGETVLELPQYELIGVFNEGLA